MPHFGPHRRGFCKRLECRARLHRERGTDGPRARQGPFLPAVVIFRKASICQRAWSVVLGPQASPRVYAFCSSSKGYSTSRVHRSSWPRSDRPRARSGRAALTSEHGRCAERNRRRWARSWRVARLLDEVACATRWRRELARCGSSWCKATGCCVRSCGFRRHHPVANHVRVIDAGRTFLLIGCVGVPLELRVGVARHVPGVRDAGRGLCIKPRRLFCSERLRAIPEMDSIMMGAGVHSFDLNTYRAGCRRPAGCRFRPSRSARLPWRARRGVDVAGESWTTAPALEARPAAWPERWRCP